MTGLRAKDVAIGFPPSAVAIREAQDAGERLPAYGSPNPAQLAFLYLGCEERVFIGGIGAGKSAVGGEAMSLLAVDNQGGEQLCLAPRWNQVERQMGAFEGVFRFQWDTAHYRPYKRFNTSKGSALIEWRNGVVTHFRSAWDKDAFAGSNVFAIWGDEIEFARDASEGEELYGRMLGRVRQESDGYSVRIREQVALVTSTARWLTGLLAALWERARAGDPKVGVVRAPSQVALGFGLTEAAIERYRRSMNDDDFDRMVLCKLGRPPGVIYGKYVSSATWPDGNVYDWPMDGGKPVIRQDWPLLFGVDWGLHPHILVAQFDQEHDLDVIIAEWGPTEVADGVSDPINFLIRFLRDNCPKRKPTMVCSDITDNPGAARRQGGSVLAGNDILQRAPFRWRVRSPRLDYERAIDYGVGHCRNRLKRGSRRRVAFARWLVDPRRHPLKQTDRGIWWALTKGYRFSHDAQGRIVDQPEKGGMGDSADHAADAFRMLEVAAHDREFERYYRRLTEGAEAWDEAA